MQEKIIELYTFDAMLIVEAVNCCDIAIFDKVFSSNQKEYQLRETLGKLYQRISKDQSNKRRRPSNSKEKFKEVMTKYYNANPFQRTRIENAINRILQE